MDRNKNYPLRINESLKEWVKKQAKKNNRSMNAEITHMLEREMQKTALGKAA